MKTILHAMIIVCMLLVPGAALADQTGRAEATLSFSMTPQGGTLSLSMTPEAAQAFSQNLADSNGQLSLSLPSIAEEPSLLNLLFGFMFL